ncbi:MAG: hypothetical protein JXR58_09085 [Bacteroidales bacterium]|nr:hypothetical protein [Bacteroidales bacterium]
MKTTFVILSAIVILANCAGENRKEKVNNSTEKKSYPQFPVDSVIRGVKSPSNGNYSYSLYFPVSYNSDSASPVVLIFDPHAKGHYPVSMYRKIANKYGFVLMASENSRNGLSLPEVNQIVSSIYSDAKNLVNINSKAIFAMGFSGGARTAGLLSQNYDIKAVIACGAGFETPNQKLNNYMIGIAGDEDFNFMELNAMLFYNPDNANLIVFEGKHEWPDEASVEAAFASLDNLFVKNNNAAKLEESFIFLKMLAETRYKEANPFYRNLFLNLLTKTLKNHKDFEQILEMLNNSLQEIKENRDRLQKSFGEEMQKQQKFSEAFINEDITWWRKSLQELEKNIKFESDFFVVKMNKRLKAYLGILAFSYCSKAISTKQIEAAEIFLEIYQLLEPENPDVFFYKAKFFILKKDELSAKTALEKSIKLGLDKKKIEDDIDLNQILKN